MLSESKKELNQKIDKIQEKYERLLTITTEDGELMKEIQVVKQEAEQAEVFDKMTRHIAETFIDEVIIYDAEKIEIEIFGIPVRKQSHVTVKIFLIPVLVKVENIIKRKQNILFRMMRPSPLHWPVIRTAEKLHYSIS